MPGQPERSVDIGTTISSCHAIAYILLTFHVMSQICEVADICCDGRVVSVLEGGYGRTPPPVPAPPFFGNESAEEPVKQKLDKTLFSECAMQHLKGLVDPYYAGDE